MSVQRYDFATGENLTLPAVYNEDGSLSAKSIITSIGVFPYRKADGGVQYELRTPEVVFDAAFIETVKNLPIYVTHKRNADGSLISDPAQKADAAVGFTDDQIEGNNVYLAAGLKIVKEDGIKAIKSGYSSLSVGYSCDLVEESGVWCGVKYDKVQTNLRADHLALVPVGRQGDQAIIRFDSDDAVLVTDADVRAADTLEIKKEAPVANMKKIALDGVEFEAEAEVLMHLNTVVQKADAAIAEIATVRADLAKVEAERDTNKDRADALEKELAEAKAEKLDSAAIQAAVDTRLAVLKAADRAEVEYKADEADLEIQKRVVMKVFPNAKLDGRDEVYVKARFDGAVEQLDNLADAEVRKANTPTTVKVDGAVAEVNSDASRKAFHERLKNQHIAGKK